MPRYSQAANKVRDFVSSRVVSHAVKDASFLVEGMVAANPTEGLPVLIQALAPLPKSRPKPKQAAAPLEGTGAASGEEGVEQQHAADAAAYVRWWWWTFLKLDPEWAHLLTYLIWLALMLRLLM